ncbi:MAG: DUF1178 family protein [Deltaproteobacteria bacterium]|nr:DUF1178 family protein [Deltaproteobacteria bacterium]
MIAFDLVCANGHKFECWFKNGLSYEEQRSYGVITCPVCQDHRVEKVLSTFGIRRSGGRREKEREEKGKKKIPEGGAEAYQALRALSEYVQRNFENVGPEFAREALKIHYGEAKKRNIRGLALPDEEKVLKEEGVEFLKFPILKRLDN